MSGGSRPERAPPAWGPAAALAAAAAVGAAAWAAQLGGASRAAPVAAAAVLLTARRPSCALAAGALAILLLAAPLIAGVAPAELLPSAWPALPGRLSAGLHALAASGAAPAEPESWSVATALLLAGTAWIAAGTLAARRSGSRACAAIVAACAPWAAAAVVVHPDPALWHGTVLALGGMLWWSSTRLAVGPAVALSVLVALLSGAAAQAVGPRHPWFDLHGSPRYLSARFTTLQLVPTFGPLADRRSGAPMLEIAAAEPALWRMQVLDVFDGGGWTVEAQPAAPLPQPAARRVWIDVRVRGLRNSLVVAPGSIDAVEVGAAVKPVAGEAWRLQSPPRRGSGYRVRSRVVKASAASLRRAPNPTGAALRRYTLLGYPPPPRSQFANPIRALLGIPPYAPARSTGFPLQAPLFGEPADRRATLAGTPYGPVAELARRLSAGAQTQWQVVARVLRYLMEGNRFRYTTHVQEPGPYPLADFLLRDRAGYCQHFAGAAALLLRLAGVPARVVAGFATGVRANGRYSVRDVDAHDWIEVYFQGYGWVPFNSTPGAAAAAIPHGLDLLAPTARSGTGGVGEALLAALVLAAAAAVHVRRRVRRERRPAGELLASLARGTGAHVGAASTLSDLRAELERAIGPRTAALVAAEEQARFAPGGPAPPRRPRTRIAAALVADAGVWRALRFLVSATFR